MIDKIIKEIKTYKFNLLDESILQGQLYDFVLKDKAFLKEFYLNPKSRIDFFNPHEKIGIEVKIKGSAVKIYRQCERYIKTHKLDHLILLSSKAMGMPDEIEGIPITVVILGDSWL